MKSQFKTKRYFCPLLGVAAVAGLGHGCGRVGLGSLPEYIAYFGFLTVTIGEYRNGLTKNKVR